MKTVLFILALGSTLATYAANKSQNFSAFVNKNVLYVTVLGDTCNAMSARLEVDPLCDKDRKTRNAVIDCKAELLVMTTEMGCGPEIKAHVLEVLLSEIQVDPWAKTLTLSYLDESLKIPIHKTDEKAQLAGFTVDNQLLLTVLTDRCNSHRVGIEVKSNCRADRMTTDYTTKCEADVTVLSTEKFCGPAASRPMTVQIDLKDAKVTSEAELLQLKYKGGKTEIAINK